MPDSPARVFAVAETAPLHVQLIAKTEFVAPSDVPWSTDADGGQALLEFAGRACYQSWSKPNPKTATNAGYLRHIIDVGHFSVLEHASVSFYITGISRSCTHEVIRHRHFSYSQLSQRYVPENESQIVVPPGMEDDDELRRILVEAADVSRATYTDLLAQFDAWVEAADGCHWVLRTRSLPALSAGAIDAIIGAKARAASPYCTVFWHHFHGAASGADLRSTQGPVVRTVLQSELLRSAAAWSGWKHHLAVHQRTGAVQQRFVAL